MHVCDIPNSKEVCVTNVHIDFEAIHAFRLQRKDK